MRALPLILSTLPLLASAHLEGVPGAPKLVGGRGLAADLRAGPLFTVSPKLKERMRSGPELENRQVGGTSGQCGPGYDQLELLSDGENLVDGCTESGLALLDTAVLRRAGEYCEAPDCQYDYGPGCDTNIPPPGASTSNIPRPHIGNVLYGGGGVQNGGIYDCVQGDVMALTFDDGPYLYTSHILDVLESYNAKATFFITGNNLGKGRIDDPATGYPAIIQRMVSEGHQIASHTWGHQNLSSMTTARLRDQMIYNEMAIRNILGFFPTYMRPPYSQCDLECETQMNTLGYHIVYFDLDTQDYLNDSPTLIQKSKDVFDTVVTGATPDNSNFLVIGHDIHEQTAYNLTSYILAKMKTLGYGSVTVGECLGDPSANWYRSAGSAVPSPSPSPTSTSSTATSAVAATVSEKISLDATCGGVNGYTCQGSTFGMPMGGGKYPKFSWLRR
ncbi:MAG: hypothetical protein M1840_008346 [Geoglossum simile]|nr:MAG: hypothetical protein M1840_008346 [Geoglossum simile]